MMKIGYANIITLQLVHEYKSTFEPLLQKYSISYFA